MSASLVGSEMCIRDRPTQFLVTPRLLAVEVATTSARFKAVVAHAPCAVSYTHLTLPTICSV
eukprot:1114056-Alexandrium_andersonii.AAC.1